MLQFLFSIRDWLIYRPISMGVYSVDDSLFNTDIHRVSDALLSILRGPGVS